jgi:Fic family protein
MDSKRTYLWQRPQWPHLRYDVAEVSDALSPARRAQGVVEGKLAALGFDDRQQPAAEAWSQDAVSTAAIEGERLDLEAVRSSVARRLGVARRQGPHASRHIDGLLDIMDDAVTRCRDEVDHARLQGWQAALFPTGFSGMTPIQVGDYRSHEEPMQIVSGGLGRQRVHYLAPPSARVPEEMDQLLEWFNLGVEPDSLVCAALAHLWFETIHPFEDGNGRVGRVLVDLVLARDSGEFSRLIRLSQRLLAQRDAYYAQLERAQRGDVDVTAWVVWFITQVHAACDDASRVIDDTLAKSRFWAEHGGKDLNPRQRRVVNILLDAGPGGYAGGMSTKKYESTTRSSRATASRELAALEALGLLRRVGAGRSTRYYPALDGWPLALQAIKSPAPD